MHFIEDAFSIFWTRCFARAAFALGAVAPKKIVVIAKVWKKVLCGNDADCARACINCCTHELLATRGRRPATAACGSRQRGKSTSCHLRSLCPMRTQGSPKHEDLGACSAPSGCGQRRWLGWGQQAGLARGCPAEESADPLPERRACGAAPEPRRHPASSPSALAVSRLLK